WGDERTLIRTQRTSVQRLHPDWQILEVGQRTEGLLGFANRPRLRRRPQRQSAQIPCVNTSSTLKPPNPFCIAKPSARFAQESCLCSGNSRAVNPLSAGSFGGPSQHFLAHPLFLADRLDVRSLARQRETSLVQRRFQPAVAKFAQDVRSRCIQ